MNGVSPIKNAGLHPRLDSELASAQGGETLSTVEPIDLPTENPRECPMDIPGLLKGVMKYYQPKLHATGSGKYLNDYRYICIKFDHLISPL